MSVENNILKNVGAVVETAKTLVKAHGLRGLAFIPFACGHVKVDGRTFEYHDHPVHSRIGGDVDGPHVWRPDKARHEPYDEKIHGDIFDFVKEGDPLPASYNLPKAVHTHSTRSSAGPYEMK